MRVLFLERGERRREHRALRIGFVVLTLMMLVPIFGRVMNGNNYASNRWSFVYAMLISYIGRQIGRASCRERV